VAAEPAAGSAAGVAGLDAAARLAKYFWRIAAAMGAASRPPPKASPGVLPCTATATAISGRSIGAKQMNQARSNLPGSCAVPVLPAMRTPGMR